MVLLQDANSPPRIKNNAHEPIKIPPPKQQIHTVLHLFLNRDEDRG